MPVKGVHCFITLLFFLYFIFYNYTISVFLYYKINSYKVFVLSLGVLTVKTNRLNLSSGLWIYWVFLLDFGLSRLTSLQLIQYHVAGFYKPTIPQSPPSHLRDYSMCNNARLEFLPQFLYQALIQMNGAWKMVSSVGVWTHNLLVMSLLPLPLDHGYSPKCWPLYHQRFLNLLFLCFSSRTLAWLSVCSFSSTSSRLSSTLAGD